MIIYDLLVPNAGNGWEWGLLGLLFIVIDGSFPHSLRWSFASLRCSVWAACWAIFLGYIPLHSPKKDALYMVGASNQSVPERAIDFIPCFSPCLPQPSLAREDCALLKLPRSQNRFIIILPLNNSHELGRLIQPIFIFRYILVYTIPKLPNFSGNLGFWFSYGFPMVFLWFS